MPGYARLSNGLWAALEGLLYPLLMLAATPVLASVLQETGFGLWMLFITVSTVGGAASAGTASAVIRMVSQSLAHGPTAIADIVDTAMSVAVSGFGLVAVALAALSVPVAALLLGKLGGPVLVSCVCIAGILLAWIEHVDQVHSAVWKAMEAFAQSARIELALRTAQFCLLLIGLAFDAAIGELIALHLLSSLAKLGVRRVLTRRRFPQLAGKRSGRASPAERSYVKRCADVWRLSLWGWLQGAGGLAFAATDRMIIGALLGPVGLAQYSVGVQLASQFHALAAFAFSVLVPEVGRLSARSANVRLLGQRIVRCMTANAVVAAAGYAILLWISPKVIVAWLGSGHAAEIAAFMLPVILAYFLLSLNVVPFHALAGLGRMREVALLSAGAGVLSAAAAGYWVPDNGLQGAGWSRVVYAVSTLALLPRLRSSLTGH